MKRGVVDRAIEDFEDLYAEYCSQAVLAETQKKPRKRTSVDALTLEASLPPQRGAGIEAALRREREEAARPLRARVKTFVKHGLFYALILSFLVFLAVNGSDG